MTKKDKKLGTVDDEYKELMYVALMMLASKDRHTIPELLYIMDADTFLRLVEVYSGRSIKIPSKSHLVKAIKTIAYYYHVEINGEKPESVRRKYNITKYNERHIKRRVTFFKKKAREKKFNIPRYFRSSKLLKGIYEDLWKPEEEKGKRPKGKRKTK